MAARQVQLTGAELHVVIAWRPPVTYGYPPDYSDVDFAAQARQRLDAVVAEVLGPTPQLSVVTRVEAGHPAPILLDAARGADLLVVGSHGHGAFVGCCSARPVTTACSTQPIRCWWSASTRGRDAGINTGDAERPWSGTTTP